MKSRCFLTPRTLRSALLFLALACAGFLPAQTLDGPDALLLEVAEGVRRVKVEVQDESSGAWSIFAVAHLDGRAGQVKLRIPPGTPLARLRVSTNLSDPFPTAYFQGTNDYAESEIVNSGRGGYGPDAKGGEWASGPTADAENSASEDTVVESDIWKIEGQTLYFFNQYRGLQIFDLADPAAPRLTGSLRLPRVGEQLYLLPNGQVALLAAEGWGRDSRILLVDPTGAAPAIVHELELGGYIQESRLIGQKLYVVTQVYQQYLETNGGASTTVYWPTATVTAFDLSDPAQPVKLGATSLPGYTRAVTATPRHFLVALQDYNYWTGRDAVYVFDLQGANPLQPAAKVQVAGQINDKFKLTVQNGILSTVSMVWNWTTGNWNQRRTTLETFTLQSAALPVVPPAKDRSDVAVGEVPSDPPPPPQPPPPFGASKLAELDLGLGESLFATRFDGSRLYVVTFLVIDPLFIVDLSNPAKPVIAGELKIPGYSTYLAPMGDRVVAVGVEDREAPVGTRVRQVTVSLFDVSDVAQPTQLARVYLGEDGQSSWSEANYDEKAVSILSAQGLILVPFQSWGPGAGQYRLQLIDLAADTLVKRGVIEHSFEARRANALGADDLVSISGRELLTIDAADRDHPAILADLRISWPADRVLLAGDHLLQVSGLGQSYWYWRGADESSALYLTPATDPQELLGFMEFPGRSLLGLALAGDRLVVAHAADTAWSSTGLVPEGETPPAPQLTFSVFSAAALPQLTLLGETTVDFTAETYLPSRWEALALPDGTLLWSNPQSLSYWWYYADMRGGMAIDALWYPGYGYQSSRVFLALGLADPAQPAVLAQTRVAPENASQFSETFLAGSTALLSYRTQYWVEKDNVLRGGYYLQALDWANPAAPAVAEPVTAPGLLVGVHGGDAEGIVLFSRGEQSAKQENTEYGYYYWDYQSTLQGSVYDGAAVYLLDEEPVGDWPYGGSQWAVEGDRVCIAASEYSRTDGTSVKNSLTAYRWSPSGAFERGPALVGTTYLNAPLARDGRLVVQADQDLVILQVGEDLTLTETARAALPVGTSVDWKSAALDFARGAWFASGYYGADFVPFSAPAASTYAIPRRLAGRDLAGNSWTTLALHQGHLGRRAEADGVGVLRERDWLFRPLGFARWLAADADLGDGWRQSAWFGFYNDLSFPWAVHAEHGWQFPVTADQGLFLYENDLGWLWTGDAAYPFLYRFDRQAWLQYLEGTGLTGTRWFFDYNPAVNDWVALPQAQ